MCEFPKKQNTSACTGDGDHMINADQLPEVGQAKFDLSVTWSESDQADGKGGITVSFESGIGKWYQIEDRFRQVISNILGEQHPPPSLLPTETAQVLAWGNGEEGLLRYMCLHEVFEAEAKLHPDSIALIDKEGSMSMTYKELDRKSDILASHLQLLGVKPDMFVGLLVDKTFAMMVSILGILKSGGAYVPMDPGFPESRIKYMVEDSGVTMLVTEMCYKELMDSIDYTDTIKNRVYVDAHIFTAGNGDDDGCNGPNTNVINLVR